MLTIPVSRAGGDSSGPYPRRPRRAAAAERLAVLATAATAVVFSAGPTAGSVGAAGAEAPAPSRQPVEGTVAKAEQSSPPRVASRSTSPHTGDTAAGKSAANLSAARPPTPYDGLPVNLALGDPVAAAKQAIADCQARFARVNDYTCTFLKRERIDGRLRPQQVMQMKART